MDFCPGRGAGAAPVSHSDIACQILGRISGAPRGQIFAGRPRTPSGGRAVSCPRPPVAGVEKLTSFSQPFEVLSKDRLAQAEPDRVSNSNKPRVFRFGGLRRINLVPSLYDYGLC